MVGDRAGGDEHDRLPVELGPAGGAARAGRAAARRAPSLVGERRSGSARLARGRGAGAASTPGRSTAYSRGEDRFISSRVASKRAVRASSRPKNSSTNAARPASRARSSAGAWNVPTLSARECRSATDAALGAHGSWTWTNSIGATLSTSSIVRDVHRRRRDGPRRPPASGSSSPTPSTRTPPSGSTARRCGCASMTRTNAGSCEGASTTTRCPEAACSAARARTKALTSCSSSQGYGVTWAMVRGSGKAESVAQGGRMVGKSRPS